MNKKVFVIVALVLFASLTVVNAVVFLEMKRFIGKIRIIDNNPLVDETGYFNISYVGGSLENVTCDFGSMKEGEYVQLSFEIIGIQDCNVAWSHDLPSNFEVTMQIYSYAKKYWMTWLSDGEQLALVRTVGYSTHVRYCILNVRLVDVDGLPNVVSFSVMFNAYPY